MTRYAILQAFTTAIFVTALGLQMWETSQANRRADDWRVLALGAKSTAERFEKVANESIKAARESQAFARDQSVERAEAWQAYATCAQRAVRRRTE